MQVKADQIVQQERLLEAENRSQRLEEKCDRLLMKLVAANMVEMEERHKKERVAASKKHIPWAS